jgi:nucleotide-binding universal stress UspA family protein
MQRALAVVDDTDAHRKLLKRAGELAAGTGAELILLSILTESEFRDGMDTVETIASVEHTGYDGSEIVSAAEQSAIDLATEAFGDLDVEYTSKGVVVEEDEQSDAILQTAEEQDCDHVFVTGRRRSPTGKAIFGDTAQSVILNFNDPVTVVTA